MQQVCCTLGVAGVEAGLGVFGVAPMLGHEFAQQLFVTCRVATKRLQRGTDIQAWQRVCVGGERRRWLCWPWCATPPTGHQVQQVLHIQGLTICPAMPAARDFSRSCCRAKAVTAMMGKSTKPNSSRMIRVAV